MEVSLGLPRRPSALQLPLFDLNNNGEGARGWEPEKSQEKSTKARICLEKAQTCWTSLLGQTVIDFMLQLTCYSALHLGEWASKIQILNEFIFHLPTSSFYKTVHAHR